MAFTKKEQSLLKDMHNEEKLCAEKYRRAAENAHDAKLKHIFEKLEQAEQNHYDTVTQMLNGTVPSLPGQSKMPARGKAAKDLKSAAKRAEKQQDAYPLADGRVQHLGVRIFRRKGPRRADEHSAAGAAARQRDCRIYAGQQHELLSLPRFAQNPAQNARWGGPLVLKHTIWAPGALQKPGNPKRIAGLFYAALCPKLPGLPPGGKRHWRRGLAGRRLRKHPAVAFAAARGRKNALRAGKGRVSCCSRAGRAAAQGG